MLPLKSFPYKIKLHSSYTGSFVSLLIFCFLFMIASWGLEFFLNSQPNFLSILQRYLLPLLALNGILGLLSQFKTSYVITCQLLLLVLFIMSLLNTLIQIGLVHEPIFTTEWDSDNKIHLLNVLVSLFKSLGSISIFALFLRDKKQARM